MAKSKRTLVATFDYGAHQEIHQVNLVNATDKALKEFEHGNYDKASTSKHCISLELLVEALSGEYAGLPPKTKELVGHLLDK